MLKINSNKFNFQFFLSDNKAVESLETGAKTFGGATKYNNGIYSNVEGTEYITLNKDFNKLSIFIPNTMNVNQTTDNKKYIQYAVKYIRNNFNSNDLKFYNTKGSWYSEDMNQVVYDDITIISFESKEITEIDINKMVQLAQYIKYEMSQEGVSININSALAII